MPMTFQASLKLLTCNCYSLTRMLFLIQYQKLDRKNLKESEDTLRDPKLLLKKTCLGNNNMLNIPQDS